MCVLVCAYTMCVNIVQLYSFGLSMIQIFQIYGIQYNIVGYVMRDVC